MTVETRPIEVPAREKTVADVLRHAALLIEERGWCRVDRETADGRLCMMGAIETAVLGRTAVLQQGNDPLWESGDWAGVVAAENFLANHLRVPRPWSFNDDAISATEVTAALRAAADAWEAQS
ncbi:MAG: hypothetical protein LC798_21945 [Chloroflexi bacterium]|nr:hypothetical protein [Chloroflexota bacterium]